MDYIKPPSVLFMYIAGFLLQSFFTSLGNFDRSVQNNNITGTLTIHELFFNVFKTTQTTAQVKSFRIRIIALPAAV